MIKEMEKPLQKSIPFVKMSLVLSACFVFLFPAAGKAADYPARPVQIVVGTAAGGPADTTARILADELGKELKEAFIVVNKPGASGTLATSLVAAAKPDGHTLLVGMTMSLSAGFALFPNITYKLSDFAPVARTTVFPLVIAVKSDSPWKTFPEFIEAAKKYPKYKSGSDGGGTGLAWDSILKPLNLDVVHIMFNGSTPNFTSLLGGHIDICTTVLTPLLPHLESKQVVLLASSSKLKDYPTVPTMTELGYPDASRDFWNGLLAPAKTPQPIVEKLSRAIKKAMANPAVNEKLINIGVVPSYQDNAEFGKYLQKEYDIFIDLGKKYKKD
jgi:tripartite-type tricarboxylate transporter receptor subunit TctC